MIGRYMCLCMRVVFFLSYKNFSFGFFGHDDRPIYMCVCMRVVFFLIKISVYPTLLAPRSLFNVIITTRIGRYICVCVRVCMRVEFFLIKISVMCVCLGTKRNQRECSSTYACLYTFSNISLISSRPIFDEPFQYYVLLINRFCVLFFFFDSTVLCVVFLFRISNSIWVLFCFFRFHSFVCVYFFEFRIPYEFALFFRIPYERCMEKCK